MPDIQTLLSGIQWPQKADVSLKDLLDQKTLHQLLSLVDETSLQQHLPEGVKLEQVIDSPQLRQTITALEYAIQSGGLRSICESLGLECTDDNAGVQGLVEAIRRKLQDDKH
jgi:hypothetical protein